MDDSKTIRLSAASPEHHGNSGRFQRAAGRASSLGAHGTTSRPSAAAVQKARRCGIVAFCGYTRPMDAAERKRTEQQARAAKTLAEKAPITAAELSQRAVELVKRVHETGEAVVVVQDGQPAAVLVGAEEFALLREHRRFVAAVEEGLADANAGRVLSTQELMRSLETEFGPIAWQ